MTDRKSMRVKNKQNWAKKNEYVLREGGVALLTTPGAEIGQS